MIMSEKYMRFDAADHLSNRDDVATYLEIALDDSDEDPTAVPRALGVIARSQNMSELARRVGMSRDGLYRALSAEGNPTWVTLLKVTSALGLRFELHRQLLRRGLRGTTSHRPTGSGLARRAPGDQRHRVLRWLRRHLGKRHPPR